MFEPRLETPAQVAPHDTLHALARRIIWFEPPERALADRPRFLAYLMTYGSAEDIAVARRHFPDGEFRSPLDHAPPGIFDVRSWTYRHLMAGRTPPPPMPRRVIP